jgi:hypothetical protein
MIEPRPALPERIALTPEMAKARLLELGEAVDAERQERGPLMGQLLGKYSLVALIAAIAAAFAVGMGVKKAPPAALGLGGKRPARAAGFAIPLGLIIRLLQPALPVILRFFAARRQASQQRAAAEDRRTRAYARR